ncbi:amidohydrolase family protein [Lactobacillus selangorensis]|nr:amidohydrolase family protein [Lactobacillus selangorensis]
MTKKETEIWIKQATVLTQPGTIKHDQDIWIKNGRIAAAGPNLKLNDFTGTTLDGRNLLFMPGLIDSHLHTGQQLLRGRVLDAKPIIWTRIMLPFESTLTPEKMQLSAQSAALEMITSGTTGFAESGSYYMTAAAKVYAQSGLRGALAYSTMDDPTLPASIKMSAVEAIHHTDALYNEFHQHGNLKVYYSLRALNACSTELVLLAANAAKAHQTFLEAHMNEYPQEVAGIIARTGKTPYEWLDSLGVLTENFLGAHSIFLTEQEKKLLQKYHIKVCHCPFSNAGKGVPDTPDLLKMGIRVGLGTDGTAHGGLSLWNEMKIFRSIMNLYYGVKQGIPNIMPAKTIFQIVLNGGAAALNEAGQLGKIQPGYKADLIGINLDQPHLYPTGNLQNTLLESVNSNDVTEMIVGGKQLMHQREVLTLDEEKIMFTLKQKRMKLGIE